MDPWGYGGEQQVLSVRTFSTCWWEGEKNKNNDANKNFLFIEEN